MGYKPAVPRSISDKVVDDLIEYISTHDFSDGRIARTVGVSTGLIHRWKNKQGNPSLKSIKRLIDAGITAVVLPDDLRQKAVQKVLIKVDKGNMAPRPYRTRITVPPIIANQVKLLLDDYMKALRQPRTYDEFQEQHEEFVRKVYYICRQG